jgi:predicted DNA-binding protein
MAKQTAFRIPDSLLDKVTKTSKKLGMSRNQYVCFVLESAEASMQSYFKEEWYKLLKDEFKETRQKVLNDEQFLEIVQHEGDLKNLLANLGKVENEK